MLKPIQISKTEEGTRLQRWFLRHFPAIPHKEFYKLCRTGQIRINSSRCNARAVLRSGDMIRIPPTVNQYKKVEKEKHERGEKYSLADLEKLRKCIIYNDDDIVAFNKPAGLAVQGGTGIKKSVDKMAAALFPYDKISLVHRLDKETSGILIVAKNQNAGQNLSAQFQNKTANKEYLALLSGDIKQPSGEINNFMVKGKVADSPDEFAPEDGKPVRAITEFKVLSKVHGLLSWVLFYPKTGRTHQLRLHSALSLNAPIVGDRIYNKQQRLNDALDSLLSTNNLFLFAHKISFYHPVTNKLITIHAEIPRFMNAVAQLLELNIPE